MSRSADCEPPARQDSESGSIGIGAMIVFIALILVAAVASTIIIKTAEELQQNAENTSQDTRDQISGKISISDVFVKTSANPLCVDNDGGGDALCPAAATDTDVATFEVIARMSAGSMNVQEGDITWYITCKVTFTTWTDIADNTETVGSTSFNAIDTAEADSLELDGTDIADGAEISAGTTFKFEIDLGLTNTAADTSQTTVGQDINNADFSSALIPGCDAEAGAGQSLGLRIVVDGGGETLATLNINSITLGKSVM